MLDETGEPVDTILLALGAGRACVKQILAGRDTAEKHGHCLPLSLSPSLHGFVDRVVQCTESFSSTKLSSRRPFVEPRPW